MAGHNDSVDPVEEPDVSPVIELVNTLESTLRDSITWEVHGAAGIGREHIHPQASPQYVEARIRLWEPPVAWRGDWRPPLKLPKEGTRPFYNTTLAKWCPPMWWPPTTIMEGQLAIWRIPGDRHRSEPDNPTSVEAPPLPPRNLSTPAAPRPEAAHPGEAPPRLTCSWLRSATPDWGSTRLPACVHMHT